MKRRIFIVVSLVACLAASVGIAYWITDVHQDRQFSVKITGPVKVYDRESPPGYHRGDDGLVDVLRPADRVNVLRIHFHEDEGSEAIRVRLRDGREGYIFCCENFELSR
jgi:hypothetical protein